MAKTSAAIYEHAKKKLIYISVICDPTLGGVTASFASLADNIIGEQGARFGFTGKRIIEESTYEKLPNDFQMVEYAKRCGMVDIVVDKTEARDILRGLIFVHSQRGTHFGSSDLLKISHHNERPNAQYYIASIFPDCIELSGDRLYGDDPWVVGGIATIDGISVVVISQLKGRNTEEHIKYNFPMSKPEGFWKILRLMKQAEKFKRPVICFVDILGAYPGKEAEGRGQGNAIANYVMENMYLQPQ